MRVMQITPISINKRQAENYAVKAAESALGVTIVEKKSLGGGSFGLAFALITDNGDKLVVKILKAKGMMKKEVYDLNLLSKHCPIRIPKILFIKESDEDIPVDIYGMERINGQNCFMAFDMLLMSKKKRLDFADKVTEALHSIHECKNQFFGDTLNPDCKDWLDCYKPFAEEVFAKAEELYALNKLPRKIIVAMREAWSKFDIIFSEKVRDACLIHGDLNIANIMVDKKRNITGFIDPLNSMYADREYDLFQFDNLNGRRFYLRETYKRKYGASKNFYAKLAFYGLWNEVFCYIRAGVLISFIMNPLIKNMHRQLKLL